MLKAASEELNSLKDGNPNIKTKILAVTALTTLTDKQVRKVYRDTPKHVVLGLTKIALEN